MHKRILLTGATGALGPALAAELLGTAERIAVLVRAADGELREKFERWRGAVAELLPPERRGELDRLEPVSGDILHDGLGMDADGLGMRGETDVVIHAAADTNFVAPPERQRAVNVDGTRRALEWAAGCPRLRKFLLVSSVFVSGSRVGRVDETLQPESPGFVTHYQRTKWEAEHVAAASGLPVAMARVSLILGAHANGGVHRPGAVHSLIKWFSRGFIPMVPGRAEARADVIATETAARVLGRAVSAEWEGPRPPVWHIAAGDDAPRMAELIEFVYQYFAGRPVWRRRKIPHPVMVEQAEFDRVTATVDESGHPALAQALRSVNRFLPDLLYPKVYETARAEALWGGPLPKYDWRETLERVIRVVCPLDK